MGDGASSSFFWCPPDRSRSVTERDSSPAIQRMNNRYSLFAHVVKGNDILELLQPGDILLRYVRGMCKSLLKQLAIVLEFECLSVCMPVLKIGSCVDTYLFLCCLVVVAPVPRSKRKRVRGSGSCCGPPTSSAAWITKCWCQERTKTNNNRRERNQKFGDTLVIQYMVFILYLLMVGNERKKERI